MSVINMQIMRYINLLDRVSRVKTTNCFIYNNSIIFAVPRELFARAMGPDAANIRKMSEQLGKRVRIIKEYGGAKDVERFLQDLVYPIKFKSIEIKDNLMTITAGGTQSKAALFGRDKRRFDELSVIVKDVFGTELKII